MAYDDFKAHEVEFLSVTNGTRTADDAPVVLITIRPDLPQSFRPHNLSISRPQAVRLAEDLQSVLSRSATCLLLLAVLGLSGCSSKFETERETTTATPAAEQAQPVVTERSRTAVAVDLSKGQEPVRTVSGDPVEFPHDPNFVIVERCVHIHIHVGTDDRKAQKLAVEMLRELQRCQWHRH